ncbi:hypothetical protein TCON_2430 [Astathelohania contejeani]|uniref:Uncharacterized protein n=1 Tax=Astathelohania contejeani TaxID=164912 RepID=A0ABQ7HW26_9MICR|nr:hypothetical protein TCON_2430 [Thelohania contejeani]
MRESFDKVKYDELLARMNRLCKSNIYSKILFKAINRQSIFFVNYHIKLLHFEPADFLKLDHEIRQALNKHKVHLKSWYKKRLYFALSVIRRYLHYVEMNSKYVLLYLLDMLKKYKNISSRRAAILKVKELKDTHFSLIYHYFSLIYSLTNVSFEGLLDA